MAEIRIVTFDLMSDDPDYYFVLTEALRDFAARERAEAEDDGDKAAFRIRLAETAEAALGRIEAALCGQKDTVAERAREDVRQMWNAAFGHDP